MTMTMEHAADLVGTPERHETAGPIAKGAQSFLERIADKVGATSVSLVFAPPVTRDGITVIPVAKAVWGFGGGIGQTEPGKAGNGDEHGASQGSGGVGAVIMSPVGYIELANGRARFRPIVGISALVPLIAAVGVAVVLIARGLLSRCC